MRCPKNKQQFACIVSHRNKNIWARILCTKPQNQDTDSESRYATWNRVGKLVASTANVPKFAPALSRMRGSMLSGLMAFVCYAYCLVHKTEGHVIYVTNSWNALRYWLIKNRNKFLAYEGCWSFQKWHLHFRRLFCYFHNKNLASCIISLNAYFIKMCGC